MLGKVIQSRPAPRTNGFTLVETLFAISIAGVMFAALYAGLVFGFDLIRVARENSRATQIMVEKMETIRLYTWDQINSNSFLPSTFVASYYPMGGANCGTRYTGTVTVADSGLNTSYAEDMKKIIVSLNWRTGSLPRGRTNTTYVSRYGLQNYIWN